MTARCSRKSGIRRRHFVSRIRADTPEGKPTSRMLVADLATRLIRMRGLRPAIDVADQTLCVTMAKLVGLRDDPTIQALGALHFAGVLNSETAVRLALLHARQKKYQVFKLHFNSARTPRQRSF